MSGGSLDYFYLHDIESPWQLEVAIKYLRKHGHDHVASEVQRLLDYFIDAGMLKHRLDEVLHAVEYAISGDWGPETVAIAVDNCHTKP